MLDGLLWQARQFAVARGLGSQALDHFRALELRLSFLAARAWRGLVATPAVDGSLGDFNRLDLWLLFLAAWARRFYDRGVAASALLRGGGSNVDQAFR